MHNIQLESSEPAPWLSFGMTITRYKRSLLVVPLVVVAVVAGALRLLQDQYTAVLKIAPSPSVQIYMWGLREPGVTQAVSKRLNLSQYYDLAEARQVREKLQSNVQFVSNLQDSFVDVRATDKDPEMARNIANAYGDALVDLLTSLHLTPASNAIYGLQSRRERAEKSLAQANARLQEDEIKAALPNISPSSRLGLVGMAGIQAETALSTIPLQPAPAGPNDLARQTLDQNELTRLQERLMSIQRSLAEDNVKGQKSGVPIGSLIAATDALQDQAYWSAMITRIDRRIDVLRATERDEVRLIRATTPDTKSGPPRITLTVAAGLAAFLLTLAFVLVRDQLARLRRSERV